MKFVTNIRFFAGISGCRAYRFLTLLFILASLFHADAVPIDSPIGLEEYQPSFYPYDGGERAEYRASWNGIPVASAEIRTDSTFVEGKKFYQVKIQARTSKYLEFLWRMRDSIESLFEAETLRPRRYVFNQRENRKTIDTTAQFDSGSKMWNVRRQDGTKVRDYRFYSQNTMDPISAAYLLRSLDFKVGDTLKLEVFGGKSRYLLTVDVVAKEQVKVAAGVFPAYKVVPKIQNLTRSGYAGRLRQATVWISADEKRIPLKITSQVFIGSVSVEMV